jgi:phosphoglycolate phosphatase-like HAD superfamily hydrolase
LKSLGADGNSPEDDPTMDRAGIKVCIFDVNGVLIDSNIPNAGAMARAFTDDPLLQNRIARLYLTLTGVDRGTKIRTIQERIIGGAFEEDEFALRWKRFKHLARESMAKAPLITGCKEVLAALGKRNTTRAALSNTPVDELEKILQPHNLLPLLDVIRGGGDWPKSESLIRFLEEFKVEPDRCLFFGDGRSDLAAAKDAGIAFVAIDPGTGEFDNEEGFHGPYEHLGEWGESVLAMTQPMG